MAQIEPMDIDAIESDFDNKENAFHCNNVLSRTPCTEKGYEELDVSELNMKLRYSITPASSPMSKSLTGPCLDNRNFNSEDSFNTTIADNGNLTRSLNSTLTKTDGLSKSKVLPLQTLSAEPYVDCNRNSAIHRLIDTPNNNVMISVTTANDIDENLSLPSACSSVPDTPEATTPTKEIPKPEGSPIMRGLKSVLSMFRPSQSPILPAEDKTTKTEVLSPVDGSKSVESVRVSTPVAVSKQRDGNSPKRSSPLKESLVFNDDLERELQWKDETTIIFKDERIPVHKLFFQNPITETPILSKAMNTTVEHMDISCDESILKDKTCSNIDSSEEFVKNEQVITGESDNEFLDCETTFTKNESHVTDNNKLEISNDIQITENVIVDKSHIENIEDSKVINSENEHVLENTVNVIPTAVPVCEDQALLTAEFVCQIDRSYANIIEATTTFLSTERDYYSKISDNHDSNIKKEIENPNITIAIDEKVIKVDDVNATEEQPSAVVSTENKITPLMNLKDKTIVESKVQENYVDNLPNVCIETLNNISTQDRRNETLSTIEIKEKSETVNDLAAIARNVTNIGDYSASDDRHISIENIETLDSALNPGKPNMSHILESNKISELELNTDSFAINKSISGGIDNEISIVSKNCVYDTNNSNTIEGVFNEPPKMTENIPVTQIIHGEEMQSNIETPEHNFNDHSTKSNFVEGSLNCHYKITDDEHVVRTSIIKDDTPIEITTSPVEASINPTNIPNTHIDLQDHLNATNLNEKIKLSEINVITKTVDGNMEYASETNKETYLLQTSLKENVVSDISDNKITMANTSLLVKEVSDSEHKLPEILIEKDGTTVLKSPSEIPLPDDEDVEQNILENSNKLKKEGDTQNISEFEKFESDTIMDVESELDVNSTKLCQDRETVRGIHENKLTIEINNIENELNNTEICIPQNCNTQSANKYMSVVEAMEISCENMEKLDATFDLPVAENNILPVNNSSENISMTEDIHESADQDGSKIQDNSQDTIAEEKVLNKTKENSFSIENSSVTNINLVNSVHPINNLDMSEKINEVNIEHQEIVDPEKKVEELDEEIITSANNSPYVSVTDLDIVPEKTPKNYLEEVENPFATNTKLASSPPISPKIVSKGYNFNFDEIDDPFATKTKIRVSPTRDTPNLSLNSPIKEIKPVQEVTKKVNRRKSQTDRKTPAQKKHISPKFNDKVANKLSTSEDLIDSVKKSATNMCVSPVDGISLECKPDDNVPTVAQHDKVCQNVNSINNLVTSSSDQLTTSVLKQEIQPPDAATGNVEKPLIVSTEKSTSSSEQYFSLGTSSGESSGLMNRSKNVFNLPEIDDMNFNPFATKSKMRMSPPPVDNISSPLKETKDVSKSSSLVEDQSAHSTITNYDTQLICRKKVNDSSPNSSIATCSSKRTNYIDSTVKEILTEDEDTVEGPFLELDDLKDTQKITDAKSETDMMNFEEIPQQERDENMENGELFIDADAFEFLLNQNKCSTVLDSGKESLFLKFDPLFATRVSSDGILAALSKVQKRQSTSKKVIKPTQKDFNTVEKSTAGPSNTNVTYGSTDVYSEDLPSNMTKPMMVVNPAVSSVITQKRSVTPKLNRRSLTSPAMAVIDRLLSLSGNSSHLEHDASIPQVGREYSETDVAITQLREMLTEKEINVHNLRSECKELKDRLVTLEVQVKDLESESAERLKKINELNERLSEKTKMNKSMAIVVEEYERTIASLIAETEQDKKRNAEERMRLIKERDEQTAHLTSMEISFSDLHSKYEKSKQIILSCKANEDVYKKSIKEFQDNFSKMQNNYELLKQHATSKLNHANSELEKMNRAHEAEVLKMNAMIKRKELHITSLEETLSQKTKANEELTAICDELINKVG